MTIKRGWSQGLLAAAASAGMLLLGCSANSGDAGSSGGGSGGDTGGQYNSNGRLYVSLDLGGGNGTVAAVDASTLSTLKQTLTTGLSGQITVNNGDLFQAGMLGGSGDVRAIRAVLGRGATVVFDPSQDVDVSLPSFVEPGSIALGRFGYWPVVADLQTASPGGPAIHLLTRYLLGSITHQQPSEHALVSNSVAGGAVAAVFYDNFHDRLFAARSDGVVDVFDGFVASTETRGGAPSVARTITPGSGGSKLSARFRGISYDRLSDTLFVADVGDPAVLDDGRIYLIGSASSASDADSGYVEPKRVLRGALTRLGNPVSLSYDGRGGLAVADTAYDHIMIFASVLNGTDANVAPAVVSVPGVFGLSGTPISVSFPN